MHYLGNFCFVLLQEQHPAIKFSHQVFVAFCIFMIILFKGSYSLTLSQIKAVSILTSFCKFVSSRIVCI